MSGNASFEAKSYTYVNKKNELKYAAYFENLSRIHTKTACKIGKEDYKLT